MDYIQLKFITISFLMAMEETDVTGGGGFNLGEGNCGALNATTFS